MQNDIEEHDINENIPKNHKNLCKFINNLAYKGNFDFRRNSLPLYDKNFHHINNKCNTEKVKCFQQIIIPNRLQKLQNFKIVKKLKNQSHLNPFNNFIKEMKIKTIQHSKIDMNSLNKDTPQEGNAIQSDSFSCELNRSYESPLVINGKRGYHKLNKLNNKLKSSVNYLSLIRQIRSTIPKYITKDLKGIFSITSNNLKLKSEVNDYANYKPLMEEKKQTKSSNYVKEDIEFSIPSINCNKLNTLQNNQNDEAQIDIPIFRIKIQTNKILSKQRNSNLNNVIQRIKKRTILEK